MAAGRLHTALVVILTFAAWTVAGEMCKDNCNGIDKGFFQSCDSCGEYVECIDGKLHKKPCLLEMKWDANKEACVLSSDTCHIVSPRAMTNKKPKAFDTSKYDWTAFQKLPASIRQKIRNDRGKGRPLECLITSRGQEYYGTLSRTVSGRKCQKWTRHSPHSHKYCRGWATESNYCRNNWGDKSACLEPKPWCYTTDRRKRWESCKIPLCTPNRPGPPLECLLTTTGHDYHGKVSKTRSGYTCQSWKSHRFHRHENCLGEGAAGNDCSNAFQGRPSHFGCKEVRPWCYTTSPKKRWDYCDIPMCYMAPPDPTPKPPPRRRPTIIKPPPVLELLASPLSSVQEICPRRQYISRCDGSCQPTCSNPSPKCTGGCIQGCRCISSYPILHKGACIKRRQCKIRRKTPKCSNRKQYYSKCANCVATCQRKIPNCKIMQRRRKCKRGCKCRRGYVNHHGKCIRKTYCPAQCPRGKRRTTCSNCVATCKNPNPKCSIMRRQRKCIIGCSCSYPLVLHNKRCIRRNRCPATRSFIPDDVQPVNPTSQQPPSLKDFFDHHVGP